MVRNSNVKSKWYLATLTILFSVFIVFLALMGFFILPHMFLSYSSNTVDILRRVVQFEKKLLALEQEVKLNLDELVAFEQKLDFHWANVSTQLDEFTNEIIEYIKIYDPVGDQDLLHFQDRYSAAFDAWSALSSLFGSHKEIEPLSTDAYLSTNEYKMWVFEQEVEFLFQSGINLETYWSNELEKKSEEGLARVIHYLTFLLTVTEQYDEAKEMWQQLVDSETRYNKQFNSVDNTAVLTAVGENVENLRLLLDETLETKRIKHILGMASYWTESAVARIRKMMELIKEKNSKLVTQFNVWSDDSSRKFEDLVKLSEKLATNIYLRRAPKLEDLYTEL